MSNNLVKSYIVLLEFPLLICAAEVSGLPGWHFRAKFQKFGLFIKWFGMKKWCLACTS